jgi:hypothetical protein
MVDPDDPELAGDNPALYSFERTDQQFAVIHVWDDDSRIPHDVLRSVCANLGIDPDVFELPH